MSPPPESPRPPQELTPLNLPTKLYGRGRELAALSDAFNEISAGQGLVLLVPGHSGVGKTALVQALGEPVRQKNGFFLEGKFNQYQQDIPLFALQQALGGLGRELLDVALPDRAQWQVRMRDALGDLGGLLTNLVPELELLLGPQPNVPDISPGEAPHRFAAVLRSFLSVFCRAEHPVVLFLDDWQWADAASLAVLRQLQVNATLRYLLLIASYRDNEMDPTHPFTDAVADLRRQAVPMRELAVRNLAVAEVVALLEDTLLPRAEGLPELAKTIHRQTAGNPFFMRALLEFLHTSCALSFDCFHMSWRWTAWPATGSSGGDVAQLFVHKLRLLPPACGHLLSLAACLGNRFDLETLALVGERSPEACRESLRGALEQKLIVPFADDLPRPGASAELASARFRFQHDRVQQAAHSLIAPDRLPAVRLKIGRLLLVRLTPEQLDEHLLEVTAHLNAGRALVTDAAGQVRLVQLNCAAAQRSRAATAYHAALQFHRAAGALLAPPDLAAHFWENHHAEALQLFKGWAESEFLEGDRAQAERCIRTATTQARTPLEQADVLTLLIVQFTLLAHYPEAIAAGRQALAALGLALPEDGFEAARDAQIARVRERLAGHSVASLRDAPVMSEPEMLMATRVLIALGPPCYRSHQRLWSVIVPKVVDLTLHYGPVPQVGYSHPAFGGLLGWVANDYATARQFGQLATRLMTEVFCQPSDQSVFYLMIGSSLRHWFEPLTAASQDYAQAWESGLRSGNLQYAAYAFGHNMYCRFFQGTPLAALIGESEQSLAFSRTRTNQWAIDLLAGGLQIFRSLAGAGEAPATPAASRLEPSAAHSSDPAQGPLAGAASDGRAATPTPSPWSEADYLAQVDAHHNLQVACIYRVLQASALLFLGEHQRALAVSDAAEPLIYTVGTQGLLPWPEHVFTRLLLLAALHPDAAPERQAAWRGEIDRALRQLEIWAAHGPANYRPKLLLAQAEVARLEGQPAEAFQLYERAVVAARASRFHQWEGRANERAASLAEASGRGRLAQIYWQEAYCCYHRWGATAKLRQLETEFLAAISVAPSPAAMPDPAAPGLAAHLAQHLQALRAHADWVVAETAQPGHAQLVEELSAATVHLREEVAVRKQMEADLRHHREQLEREVQQRTEALEISRAMARQLEQRAEEIETQRVHLAEASASTLNLMEDIVVARDRTEQVNRKLQASEGQMRALLASMDDLVFVLDRNLVFQEYHQPSSAELLFPSEFFSGKRLQEIGFPEPALSSIQGALTRTLETGAAAQAEYWLDLPQGRTWFDMQVTAFRGEGDLSSGLTCVARNVTAAKQAAAALQESERQLAALMSNLPGMAYRCRNDRDWTMEFVSEGCQALTGYSAAELTGSAAISYADLIHPDDRKAIWDDVQQALARRGHFQLHYRIQTAAGETRWIWEQGLGVYSPDGALLGLEGFILDVTEQKRAEDALKLFQALVESAEEAVAISDPAGNLIYINPAHEKLFGYALAEARRRNYRHLYPPESRAVLDQVVAPKLARGESWEGELEVLDRAGRRFPLWERAGTVRDAAGKVLYAFGFMHDITERKQAEAKLKASEARYRLLAENGSDVIWLLDLRTQRFTYTSPAVVKMRGFTPEEVSQHTLAEALTPESCQQVATVLPARLAAFAAGDDSVRTQTNELDMFRRDGSIVPTEVVSTLIADEHRQVTHIQGVTRNISDRKQAEAELRASEQRFRSYFALPLVGFAVTSPEQGWVEVNDRLCEMLGYSHEELAGMTWADLTHPDDLAADVQQFNQVLAGELEGYSLDKRFLRKDGTALWISLAVRCVRSAGGAVDYFVALLQDISDRKHKESLLAKYQILSDQARDIMLFVDPADGSIVEANQAAVSAYGYERAGLLARKIYELRAKDTEETTHLQLAQAVQEGILFETHHQGRDGRVFPVEVSARAAQVEGRTLVLSVVRDITERKQAQEQLHTLNQQLEQRVAERTAELQTEIAERRQTAEALRESEEKLRAIIATSLDAIVTADVTGRCVDCNPAAVTMYGFPDKAALLASSLLDLAPLRQPDGRESREHIAEKMAEILATGGATFAWDHQRADGTVFPSEISIALTEVRGQKLLHGIVRDVSERRRAEVRLRVSEQRHRDLVETAPDWVWEVDAQGIYVFSSGQARLLLGYEMEEILGRTPFDLMPPQEAQRVAPLVLPLMARGEPIRGLENTVRHKDGRFVIVETNGVPIFDAAGKLRGYRGLDHDITERKQAEAQALQLTHRLNLAVRAGGVGIWDYDIVHNRLSWDEQMFRLYGVTREQFSGAYEAWQAGLHPEDRQHGHEEIQAAIRGEKDFDTEFRVLWPDGSIHHLRANALVERDADGHTLKLVGTNWDITAQKDSERVLRESEEKFRSIVEASPMAMYFYRLEAADRLTLTGANPAADRIIGIAHQELVGKSLEEAFPNLTPTEIPEMYRNVALEKIGAQQFEIPYRDDRFTGYYSVQVFRTGPRTLAVSFLDISARRRAEAALRESEEKFRIIFETSKDAIITLDTAGRCLDCNQAAVAMFGCTGKEALLGDGLAQFTPAQQPDGRDSQAAFQQMVPSALARGNFFWEWHHQRADGTVFPVEVSISVGQINGQPVLHGIGRDVSERRRAEAALRESEENLRAFFDTIDYFFFILDLQRNILRVNRTVVTRLGYPEEELAGRSVLEMHPPDRRAEAGSIVAAMLAGTRDHCPVPLMAKDGTLIPVETRVIPGTWQGQPALFGVSKDISELRLSEEKFSGIFQRNPTPMALSSFPHRRFLDVNAAFEHITGYTRQEVLHSNAAKLSLFTDSTQEARVAQAVAEQKSYTNLECCLRAKDGSLIYGLLSGDVLPLQTGKVWLTVMIDITERKRAEAQLRKLQSAVEQSPTVVVITDRRGIIEYVNPGFEAQTGYTAAEARGGRPSLLKSGTHSREFYTTMWQTLRAGQTWHGELCNRRKNGTLFWEIATIAPIRDGEGAVTHFVATKDDITARRQAELELRQAKDAAEAANRAKGVFLANMSHEIRTPMNAILGFAQLLLRDAALSGHHLQQVTTIQRSGQHLLRIINDVLEMSRIESGRVTLNPAPFDLHLLLEDLERIFHLRAADQGSDFQIQRADGLPRYLLGDETKLNQVFINLLGNAVKFTPRGGAITLRVRADAEVDGTLRLHAEVADTGAGIAPGDLPHLFAAFFQTATGQQVPGGSGLGLAISREFVRLMGGELTVRSRVGVGSTFGFDVRMARVEASAVLAQAAPAPQVLRLRPDQPECRVLVADDQVGNRELLEHLLTPLGFALRLVADGAEAVAQCQAWRPHLVLMDLRMPVLDGFAATRQIRAAHGAAVKILALSAGVLAENQQQAMAAGVDAFLGKPFKEADLLAQIKALAGVDYVYADPPLAAPAPDAAPMAWPTAEEISRLPVELVDALREATCRAEYDEMLTLVEQAAARDEHLGRRLRQMVEGFDYAALQQVLLSRKNNQ